MLAAPGGRAFPPPSEEDPFPDIAEGDIRIRPLALPAEAFQSRPEMATRQEPCGLVAQPARPGEGLLEHAALGGMVALLLWGAWVSLRWATARLRSRTVEPAVGATTRE